MKITYRKTIEKNGCIISCLAMATGKTFEEVLKGLEQYWKNDGADNGVDDVAWMAYLAARGYAIQDISYEYDPEDKLLDPWPIPPFAPVHMVFVYDEGPHAIIMDDSGRIYDGNDKKKKKLSDYYRVYRIVGIWKVREKLEFIK
jgi:hypothetical protein